MPILSHQFYVFKWLLWLHKLKCVLCKWAEQKQLMIFIFLLREKLHNRTNDKNEHNDKSVVRLTTPPCQPQPFNRRSTRQIKVRFSFKVSHFNEFSNILMTSQVKSDLKVNPTLSHFVSDIFFSCNEMTLFLTDPEYFFSVVHLLSLGWMMPRPLLTASSGY